MKLTEINKGGLSIFIENPRGSYKSFEIKGDPVWKDYPLSGVTYPVDYGYIDGYKSEDDQDLDVFVGSGNISGYIKIWRCDVPIETKFVIGVTEKEWDEIINIFNLVLKEKYVLVSDEEFRTSFNNYAR